ncbi:MAG: hypothetical protein ABSG91_12540 [Syntrophobacteraceae bacterium]|jgi:hypothetical protein
MPKILKDFIRSGKSAQGAGFFADDEVAVKISRTIGRNQIRRFQRYGEVPTGFFRYVKERGIVPSSIDASKKAIGRSVDDLLNFLWNCPQRDEKSRDAADYIRKHILLSIHPELRKSFTGQDGVWEHLENAGKEGNGPRKK